MRYFSRRFLISFTFCVALIPLITELNRTGYGCRISEKSINHLFYMDDLKLFAKHDHELEGLLQTVKKFSDDIVMKFGLEKCAKAAFLEGRLEKSTSMELGNSTKLKILEQKEVYKYLGVNERNGIQRAIMEEKFRKRMLRGILKTELNSANQI